MTINEPFVAPQRSALRKSADTNVHPSMPSAGVEQQSLSGGNTGDSVLQSKPERAVRIEMNIPKSLRKRLRTRAGELDISVDELAVHLLRDGIN